MIKYKCPMCGWEGTETSYYSMLGDDGDTYNEDACPICVNDYENHVLDELSSKYSSEPIYRCRAEMSWNLDYEVVND